MKALPRGLYEVECEDGKKVIASFGAEARRITVRVQPGDRVRLSLSPRDPTRGRIESRIR